MIRKLKIAAAFIAIISCKKEDIPHTHQRELRLLETINDTNTDRTIRHKQLDSLYQHLLQQKNDSTNRGLLFKVSGSYYNLGQYGQYLGTAKKIQQLAAESKDTAHLARSLYFIGDYHEGESQLDSAFKYYSRAERLYRRIGDTLNSGRTALYKAGILYDAGIFTESEIQTAQALELLSSTGNERLVYESYNLMALNLKELNNPTGSLNYFNLALEQLALMEEKKYDPKKLLKSRASIYNNMGNLYEKMKDYTQATELFQKGLASRGIRKDHPKLYAMLLNNYAGAALKSGEHEGRIEALLLESLKIREGHEIEQGIVASKISIGAFYLHRKDTGRAIDHIRQGYALSKKIGSSYDSRNALKLLSEIDQENSRHYAGLYQKISDSLYHLERATKNKFARIAYETNQIEKKNAYLSKRSRDITTGAACIIFMLGALLIIYRLRSRNKELLLIKGQNEADERIYQLMLAQQGEADAVRNDERNRIAMELHDGIVNRIFSTRFNLMQLKPGQSSRKEELVQELIMAEAEIRKVSHDLQQNLIFRDDSFQKALQALVGAQQNGFHTRFDLSIDKYIDWSPIANADRVHLYRIIQEAVQNINKHARASEAHIMLLKTGAKTTLRISDNGTGFNIEKARGGIGLKNIRQRALALGGELEIVSNEAGGTVLKIVF